MVRRLQVQAALVRDLTEVPVMKKEDLDPGMMRGEELDSVPKGPDMKAGGLVVRSLMAEASQVTEAVRNSAQEAQNPVAEAQAAEVLSPAGEAPSPVLSPEEVPAARIKKNRNRHNNPRGRFNGPFFICSISKTVTVLRPRKCAKVPFF